MQNNPKATYTTVSILAIAMHFSLVMFCFMSFILSQTNQSTPVEASVESSQTYSIYYLVFATISLVNSILCAAVPAVFKRQTNVDPNDFTKKTNSLFLDFNNVTEELMRLTIIRFALAESVGIFGFVYSFLTKNFFAMLPFVFVALSLQIIVGPFVGKIISSNKPPEEF